MKDKKLDYKIIFLVLILFVIGIFSLSGTGLLRNESVYSRGLLSKQIFWFMVSWIFFFFGFGIGYQKFLDLSLFLYLFSLGLLGAVLIIGPIRSGAQRWLNIGGLNFQPAEFAKLTALLILTRYFVTHRDGIKSPKIFLTALGIILPYIGLIFLQPDLGSALVMVPLFLSLSFICGVKRKNLFILFFLGILFSPLFWYLLKDYQKQRLLVFLNPHIDPLGAGYTIIQAKIAIGSGRLWGKGWGSHLFSFLPESHTDFIFASLAEQGGFFGAGLVILIYYLLLKEIIWKGILSHNLAEKAIAGGIATLLFSHIFINIGMCLGILPVVGIPLPFISYGGSHLVVNMWALGIVSSLGRER